jgi:hypothetical protein
MNTADVAFDKSWLGHMATNRWSSNVMLTRTGGGDVTSPKKQSTQQIFPVGTKFSVAVLSFSNA